METIIYNFVNALGWSIFHSLWIGGIFYILFYLIQYISANKRSSYKFNLAMTLQIGLIITFVCTFIYYYNENRIILPQEELSPITVLLYTPIQDNSLALENLFPYLATLYILGFIFQATLLINSYLKLKLFINKGLSDVSPTWHNLFENAKAKLALHSKVQFHLSNIISSPMTVGFMKPIILFPIAYVNRLSYEQVEAILIHELAHIKRNDYLLNLIKVFIESILFFNPFIWQLSKIMEYERENACDDLVLGEIKAPILYATALAELETLRHENAALTLAATGNKNQLLERIKRITNMESNHKNSKQRLIALLASTFTLVGLAIFFPIKESIGKETEIISATPAIPETIETTPSNSANILAASEPLKIKTLTLNPDTTTATRIMVDGREIHDTMELPEEIRQQIRLIEKSSANWAKFADSPEWKDLSKKLEQDAQNAKAYFESPEWKDKIKAVEDNAKRVGEYFNSPQWKENIALIEDNARKIVSELNFQENDEKFKLIEKNARKVEELYNSAEFKEKIALVEKNAKELKALYNSQEYKQKIAAIEDNAKKLKSYYDSPEYKQHIALIEDNAKKMREFYDKQKNKNESKN